MKLTEAEMRMVFQIESTNQNAALNEIYMTWRYAPNPATKETAESLLDKLRPLSDQECIEIAAQGDHFDHIRELYTQMLRKQLERGNNGLIKTKYLTLTIEARDSKTARARFSRIVMDALNHFKVMGALAKELGGKEWLEMLHGILHPDGERFAFEWSWLAPSGLSVQDFIAPSSFRFGEARKFTMADKFCAVSFLQISAPEMDDRMLTELLDTDNGLLVSLHIRSMDQNEAIKTVKRKITDIDSMKIDAQKKAVREGFDMDIIPTDLATYAGEAKNILRDLQSRNERMFLMTFLVVNFADSKQKLENDLLRAASVAQKYNCSLVRLDFQQEDGFVSALPLGVNRIKIQRGLTTSAVAVFVPFTTQEIFHGGEALYYGLNATSGNMILADRKKLKTPNGMILGTPGSGKSFSAKRSIVGVFLNAAAPGTSESDRPCSVWQVRHAGGTGPFYETRIYFSLRRRVEP